LLVGSNLLVEALDQVGDELVVDPQLLRGLPLRHPRFSGVAGCSPVLVHSLLLETQEMGRRPEKWILA
jgi:hypothetical protein